MHMHVNIYNDNTIILIIVRIVARLTARWACTNMHFPMKCKRKGKMKTIINLIHKQ